MILHLQCVMRVRLVNCARMDGCFCDNSKGSPDYTIFSRKMEAVHDFAREGDVDNLLKCIENGISVNVKDSEGWPPLHWAVDRGHLPVTELLFKNDADVNAKDNEGQTPLHYAVVCDREGVAEYLVKHNADVYTEDNDGTSPSELCEKTGIGYDLQKTWLSNWFCFCCPMLSNYH